jgi:hypothetical protein
MDYENDYISETKSDTTENELDKIRKMDKRYYSYNKKVYNEKQKRFKTFRIGLYACGDVGSRIRNAVTGVYYGPDDIVGSKNELNFHSVRDVTWYLAQKPLLFYYDSEEQYQKHRNPSTF